LATHTKRGALGAAQRGANKSALGAAQLGAHTNISALGAA